MGLLDKFANRFAGPQVDYVAELSKVMELDDPCLAASLVIASAYERGGGGISVGNMLLNKATALVENAVSSSRHVGGADDSIARRIPLDSGAQVLAVSRNGVSLWDCGMTGTDFPPTLQFGFPRADIASITDTGQRAQGGVPVARITFRDQSFFDYRLMSKPGPQFWSAVADF